MPPKLKDCDLPVYRRLGYVGQNFEIVMGSSDGTKVYKSESFGYVFERENGKIHTLGGRHPVIQLKCKRYAAKYGKCPVRARVSEEDVLEITRNEHNHCAQDEETQFSKNAAAHAVREEMRKNPTSDPKVVFDSYTGAGATELEFPNFSRQLHNIKNQALPRAPKSVEEIITAVRQSEYSYLLKEVARFNDQTALIWFPDELEDIL